MRRRDFMAGLLLVAPAVGAARAQQSAKRHRIAIVLASGPVTRIDDPASRSWRAFWEELRRLGDVDGQNLIVERYSGEGRLEGYADLAREVVRRNPDVIVPIGPPIMQAISAVTGTIPIVGSGAYTELDKYRIWHAQAATLPASLCRGTRFMESACRSLRKLSLRRPRSRFWT